MSEASPGRAEIATSCVLPEWLRDGPRNWAQ